MEGRLLEVYEREHTIAETLQRSLLPERLPRDRGRRARRALPAGRARRRDRRRLVRRARAAPTGAWRWWWATWSGHGLRAAASMGQLRNAFRAYGAGRGLAGRGGGAHQPAGDERRGRGDGHGALPRARPRDRRGRLRERRPPAAARARAGRRALPRGRPLGADRRGRPGRVPRGDGACSPPGASLLLYTDGLVERRDEPLERAPRRSWPRRRARRRRRARAACCDARARERARPTAARRRRGAPRVRPRPVAAEAISLTLPAEPESLPSLRRRLARFLHAAGADDAETYEITLTSARRPATRSSTPTGPGDADLRRRGQLRRRRARGDRARHAAAGASSAATHRGRGLNIIEGLMDDVEVSTEDGRHAWCACAGGWGGRGRRDHARRDRGRAPRRHASSRASAARST